MANGFKPVRMRDGSAYTGAAQRCYFDDASTLFVGDLVKLDTEAEATTGVLKVLASGAGGNFYGVCVGLDPNRADLTKTYMASGDTGYVMVATDNNVVYQAHEDDGSLVIADVGTNCDMAAGAGGNTVYGTSSQMISSTGNGTGADVQLKLIGKAQIEGNDIGAATPFTIWEVTLNESVAAANAAGV